ncbi:acyltransferase [Alicyclobacillus sp. ALC3]|uniref:acyltransferase n=1 Tax=Alicyclobacillus sp. ALC3 TaxID=2796143 RepID=UPI00237850B3|nr:acyltransferase [Alicyclobacillus sp. ALC3]
MAERRHLYEIDLMRAFIMLCVLSVHTTSFFNSMNFDYTFPFVSMGALITTLHYTREGFFFITGLVLFVTYYHRPFRTLQFWKKRFTLIVVPYLAFNAIYVLSGYLFAPNVTWSWAGIWRTWWTSVATGHQWFLYYVLVSMQLYIVFPLLLKGLRKFERYQLYILIGSFIFQLVMMWAFKFNKIPGQDLPWGLRQVYFYRDRFVLTYQFWFIAGGIMACHYDKVLAFVDRHRLALRAWLVFAILFVWAHYVFDHLVLHQPEHMADTVLQPIMIPYSLLVTANMWYAGVQWSRRRLTPGWKPFSWFVTVASSASFGIFLIQPLPLHYMENTISAWQRAGNPAWLHFSLWPFCILFVYLSSMVIAHWIGKVPILAYIVGRKVNWPRRNAANSVTTRTA